MKFDLLLADPPWRYSFSKSKSRRVENQYPTMTTAQIATMSIDDVCADDCVLFLWATMPKLRHAFDVMDGWKFEYKTGMAWDKMKKGMGFYVRGEHELLLIGTRGLPGLPLPKDRPGSMIREKRGRHSKKPLGAYEKIERMYPNKSKLELFARDQRDGWYVWGDEVTSTVIIPNP